MTETLYFGFGVLATLTLILIIVGTVMLFRLNRATKTLRTDVDHINPHAFDSVRRNLYEVEKEIRREIKEATDRVKSYTDSRIDKLLQHDQSTK